jgi:hypothetical protein
MMIFVELIAVELAVTVSLGAVFGFVSRLMSMPEQAERRNRRPTCFRCRSVTTFKAAP